MNNSIVLTVRERGDVFARCLSCRHRESGGVRRKTAVMEAVRSGWLPVENACYLCLSVDELFTRERGRSTRSSGLHLKRPQILPRNRRIV